MGRKQGGCEIDFVAFQVDVMDNKILIHLVKRPGLTRRGGVLILNALERWSVGAFERLSVGAGSEGALEGNAVVYRSRYLWSI
jgi:hypothetical protein